MCVYVCMHAQCICNVSRTIAGRPNGPLRNGAPTINAGTSNGSHDGKLEPMRSSIVSTPHRGDAAAQQRTPANSHDSSAGQNSSPLPRQGDSGANQPAKPQYPHPDVRGDDSDSDSQASLSVSTPEYIPSGLVAVYLGGDAYWYRVTSMPPSGVSMHRMTCCGPRAL
jgi:hypothetical protein